MPTEYTAKIYEGNNVSGKEFLIDCARAFGACIMMRDEPSDTEIPEEFKPSTYHLERLEEAKLKLEQVKDMSHEDIQNKIDTEYDDRVKYNQEGIVSHNNTMKRYLDTLTEVKTWIPPTDEHKGLKEFAINQLQESIKFDCSTSYYEAEVTKPSVKEWFDSAIEQCESDIKYHTKEYKAEVERTDGRNKWIKDLRDSLKSE